MTANTMTLRSTRRSWLTALAALTLMPPAWAAADHSQFSGDWQLNRSESDDPEEKLKEALGSGQGGRRGGLLKRRAASQKIQQAMERLAEASENISVQVDGNNFIIEAGGHSRTLVADGEKKQQQGQRGSAEQVSEWQGDEFVTHTTTSRGARITSTHSLSEDAQKLLITRKIEGQQFQQPVVFRLVYDRKS